jgi:hypothetical protein
MDDKQQLMEVYRQNPCRTLPNALWKTITPGDDIRVNIRWRQYHHLTSLAIWQDSRLMAFWCEDIKGTPLSSAQVAEVPFALVDSAALSIFENRQFSHQEAFFRLIHKGSPPDYICPPGFVYRDAYPQEEVKMIARFVHNCYQNMNVDESIIWDGSTIPFLSQICGFGSWMRKKINLPPWGLRSWITEYLKLHWNGFRSYRGIADGAWGRPSSLNCCAGFPVKQPLRQLLEKSITPPGQIVFTASASSPAGIFGGC